MARNSLSWKSYNSAPNDCARSSLIRSEEERLRSENDSRLNEGNGATFFEKSDRDVLHLLKLPNIVWSSAEQQVEVNGTHGFESFIAVRIALWVVMKTVNGIEFEVGKYNGVGNGGRKNHTLKISSTALSNHSTLGNKLS